MEADFSGWATRVGLQCSDGRTIMPSAFKHQDKAQVPLVWQHGHNDPTNVLGHAILEDRPEGVYCYGFFNDTDKAVHMKGAVDHRDIKMLSIWANELMQRGKNVIHGKIREVSLVLNGANPGALIENVTIRHSDGGEDVLDDEAIIYTNEEIEHADSSSSKAEEKSDDDDTDISEIFNSLSDKQKDVVHYLIGQALESGAEEKSDNPDESAEHSNIDADDQNKEGITMTNVFEQGKGTPAAAGHVISHADMEGIFAEAKKPGSTMKQALEGYALSHGIDDISTLFPEATALTAAPEFFKRRTEWVNVVLSGAKKTPFSRIKTHFADLNYDEARAKGYIKGNFKKEEFFGVAGRVTTPTTIYKKQKLDRDDILDITDFDVVSWMKGEMRLMLEEELARAILIGDGRAVDDEDKIPEGNIRPIATDHDLYTVAVNVNLDDASSDYREVINALIRARQHYRGTGLPTMFTTETVISEFLLLTDTLGRDLFPTIESLTTKLRLAAIVPVEVLETEPDIVAVLVNMSDYTIGADKGGQTTLFDDFDIDYNQYKYLIETRVSGTLTKLKSAMVVRKVTGTDTLLTSVNPPTFNPTTGVVTIVATANVTYKNADTGATLATGAQPALDEGETLRVVAEADSTFYFATSEDLVWQFTRRPATP